MAEYIEIDERKIAATPDTTKVNMSERPPKFERSESECGRRKSAMRRPIHIRMNPRMRREITTNPAGVRTVLIRSCADRVPARATKTCPPADGGYGSSSLPLA